MKRPDGFDPAGVKPTAPASPRERGTRAPRPATPRPTSPQPATPQPTPATAKPARREPPKPAARDGSGRGSGRGSDRGAARGADRARKKVELAEARRFTRRSRQRRVAALSIVSIVAVLGILLAVAVYSPLLALRTITVDGNRKLSTEQVLSAVDGQLGTPLALVDLGKIRAELGRFTLIRSYVTEIIPPSTLVIHLVERQAIGSLARGGMFDQVDPAGVVLGTSADAAGLPVISVGPSGSSSSAFRPAVDVLLAIPSSVLRHVQSVSATTADDVSLILSGSSTNVVWGSAAQSTLKARVLTAMLARPECRSQAVIDVSAPLAPICGPK